MTMQQNVKGKRWPSRHPWWTLTGACVLTAVVFSAVASGSGSGAATAGPTVTTTATVIAKSAPPVTMTGAAAPTVTMTTKVTVTKTVAPAAADNGITEGTYQVGTEIKAGTYKTTDDGSGGCYWARLSSSSETDIIDNHLGAGPTTVVIRRTDKFFETRGCNPWRKVA